MATGSVSSLEAQSFERLRKRLMAIGDASPPPLDPRSVALRSLVIVDSLERPEIKSKLRVAAKAGADLKCVTDLREAAHAALFVTSQANGPSAGSAEHVPEVIRDDARAHRFAMTQVIENGLHDSDDARLWLEVIRQSKDDVDLMFDLRILARIFRENEAALRGACDGAKDGARANELAEALEAALSYPDSEGEWRDWLARTWTHMATLFEEVCRIARFVLHGVPGMTFPSLPTIARSQRRLKSSPVASGGQWQRSQRPPATPSAAPEEGADVEGKAMKVPGPPPLPLGSLGLAPRIAEMAASAGEFSAATAGDLASLEPVRTAPRFNVELQVNVFSESNFYVGFTENLSATGIFVATHVLRPIGSSIEVSVLFPGRSEAVRLSGEVRWIREISPGSDGWPGMGIRFDSLTPEQDALMQEFLRAREPLFFDE